MARSYPTWRSSNGSAGCADLSCGVHPSFYLEHVEGRGRDLFAEVCRRDLEGIVAKWKRGTYRAAPLSSWVNINNPKYARSST